MGAVVVASLSYVVVLVETRRTDRELREQKLQQTKVRELARTQIRLTIDVLLRPYRLFLKGVVPVDDWDRLDSDAGYVLEVLGEPRPRSGFHSIDARAEANVYPKCKNWELLAERTRAARDLLGQLVTKFVSYLSAAILDAVEALRSDEMAGMPIRPPVAGNHFGAKPIVASSYQVQSGDPWNKEFWGRTEQEAIAKARIAINKWIDAPT